MIMMRKDALQKLLAKSKNNHQKQLLEQFLILNPHDDISIQSFEEYLQCNGLAIHNSIKEKMKINDTNFFSVFLDCEASQGTKNPTEHHRIQKDTKEGDRSSMLRLVSDSNKQSGFATFLDDKNTVRLTLASSRNAETLGVSHWKSEMIEAGCAPALMEKLLETNVIQDYKKLYTHFTRMQFKDRVEIREVWELLFLSGEHRAYKYATDREGFNGNTKNGFGENALHLAAYVGDVSMIQYALSLGINVKSVTYSGKNALHLAAACGEAEAVNFLLDVKFELNPEVRDLENHDAFWHADQSRYADVIRKLLATSEVMRLEKENINA